MTFKHVTLAMDLSLNGPGFAVLAVTDSGQPILLEKSYVKTKGSHGKKLTQIHKEITNLLFKYEPEYVVREQGFSRFARTTQAIFKVVGLSDYTVFDSAQVIGHGEVVEEIATTSVKKAVTGDGKATKEDVANAVFRILQIDNTDEFYTSRGVLIDDMTDACAVGLAYYIEKELIAV